MVLCAAVTLVVSELFKSYRLGIVAQTQADITADASAVIVADDVIPDYNEAKKTAKTLEAKNKALLNKLGITIDFSEINKEELLNDKTITVKATATNSGKSVLSKLCVYRKAKVRIVTDSLGTNTDTFPTDYHYICYPYYINEKKEKLTADEYMRIVLQFDVENTERYKADDSGAKQNVYIWDITRALGCELPLFYNKLTCCPIAITDDFVDEKGTFLLKQTENFYDYFQRVKIMPQAFTKCYWAEIEQTGTKEEYYKEIQSLANEGTPVILLYKSGKTQVVLPSYYGEYDEELGFAMSYASSVKNQESQSYIYEKPYGNFVAIKYNF